MRLAATVMLVRDRPEGGIEVFLVRRSGKSPFAPDAFVFPGGTVDPGDYAENATWPAERLAAEFRAEIPTELPASEAPVALRDAAALVRAAVRELREEGSISVDPSELRLFSHWITPPTEPRRYNTFFFLARAPRDAHGAADAFETHDAQWLPPAEALHHHEYGVLHLIYPTIKHLQRLQRFDTTKAALEYASKKSIQTIMPDRSPGEGFAMPANLEDAW